MANWFEDVTKNVADEKLSGDRHTASASSIAGLALASWITGQAWQSHTLIQSRVLATILLPVVERSPLRTQ